MRRLLTILGLVLVLSAVGVGTTAANPGNAAVAPGHALGIVPVLGMARGGGARPTKSKNLTYHGGPVMQAGNNVYAIFWAGSSGDWGDSGSGTYINTINRYFGDVANDHGLKTNVYYSDSQYTGPTGQKITDQSSFDSASNSFVDTNPYPTTNNCSDKATRTCLTDDQLRAELQNVIDTEHWGTVDLTTGVQSLFFIFTPKGVGSCINSSTCAYTNYCAYHWAFGGSRSDGTDSVLYAVQPYGAQSYHLFTCDSGQRPNGTAADATINLVSHEHNEAITDELGNAWYDSSGYENGDKCAWNFGTAQGTNGAKYNQTINGNSYYLQQEWSNKSSGCVLQGT
jgi:hypothetical protein